MDDTAAGVALGLLAMAVLHGVLNARAGRAAERQLRDSFIRTGSLHATVREQAPFGLFGNDIRAVDAYGSHIVADGMPFTQIPRSGWKGRIDHLRLHLTDSTLAGLPVSRLDADVPGVAYDLGRAFYQDRLVIRRASQGTVRLAIDQENLSLFAERKYGKLLRSVTTSLEGSRLSMSGETTITGKGVPFTLSGSVVRRTGNYLDIMDGEIMLNGNALSPEGARSLLDQFNPIVDVDKDLHLGGVLSIVSVSGHDGQLIVEGSITVPLKDKQDGR